MKKIAIILLAAVGVSFIVNAQAESSKKLDPIFIISDIKGHSMEVKDIKLIIIQGSEQTLTDTFPVIKGDAQITLSFKDLMGFKNHWKTNQVELFFVNGDHFIAKIPTGVKFHQLKGTAIIGNITAAYKLNVPKLLSIYRKGYRPPAVSKK